MAAELGQQRKKLNVGLEVNEGDMLETVPDPWTELSRRAAEQLREGSLIAVLMPGIKTNRIHLVSPEKGQRLIEKEGGARVVDFQLFPDL